MRATRCACVSMLLLSLGVLPRSMIRRPCDEQSEHFVSSMAIGSCIIHNIAISSVSSLQSLGKCINLSIDKFTHATTTTHSHTPCTLADGIHYSFTLSVLLLFTFLLSFTFFLPCILGFLSPAKWFASLLSFVLCQ